jgi:hypothetical protein
MINLVVFHNLEKVFLGFSPVNFLLEEACLFNSGDVVGG